MKPQAAFELAGFGLGVLGVKQSPYFVGDMLSQLDASCWGNIPSVNSSTPIACMEAKGTSAPALHMAGGTWLYGLMKQFVDESLEEVKASHNGCIVADVVGTRGVRGIVETPWEEVKLLRSLWGDLDYKLDHNKILARLVEWSAALPYSSTKAITSEDQPACVLVNRTRRGYTLLRDEFKLRTGLDILSIDLWAGPVLAATLTDDPKTQEYLAALYDLVNVGALRRLGSRNLQVVVL